MEHTIIFNLMLHKKFNPQKRKLLNDNKRFKLIPPEIIIESIKPTEPGNMVDYGCGTGFFTFYIANAFPDCRIFALDIEIEMIDEMIKNNNTHNVFPLQVENKQIPFAEEDLIAIWSIDVYHELKNPKIWLKNSYKSLCQNGKILIIDWSADQNPEIKIEPPPNQS